MSKDTPRSSGDGLQKEFSDMSALRCDPLTEEGASKTRQSELDSTDINKIVDRFARAGLPLPTGESRFLDVSEVPDFRGAVEQVARAEEYFMSLPARARALFDNDVATFLDKVSDPTQLALMVEAGVVPQDEVKVVKPQAVIDAEAKAELKGKAALARSIERELDREDDGRFGQNLKPGKAG